MARKPARGGRASATSFFTSTWEKSCSVTLLATACWMAGFEASGWTVLT